METPNKETVMAENDIAHVEDGMDGIQQIDTKGLAAVSTTYQLQGPQRRVRKTGIERRLVLKQDLLLVPLLALIYFVTFLVGWLLYFLLLYCCIVPLSAIV